MKTESKLAFTRITLSKTKQDCYIGFKTEVRVKTLEFLWYFSVDIQDRL